MPYIADAGGRVAEHNNGGAVVVVDEGPQVAARAHHGPLCHDVLPRVRVALQRSLLINHEKSFYYFSF